LVIGATVGAQKASQLHFLWNAYRDAEDPPGKKLAENARRSLAAWNLGLREGVPFEESRQPPALAGPASISEFQVTDPVAQPGKSTSAFVLAELDMPVTYEVSNEDFEDLCQASSVHWDPLQSSVVTLRRTDDEEGKTQGKEEKSAEEKRKLEEEECRKVAEEQSAGEKRRLEEGLTQEKQRQDKEGSGSEKLREKETRRWRLEDEQRRSADSRRRSVLKKKHEELELRRERERLQETERRRLAREKRRQEDVNREEKKRRTAEKERGTSVVLSAEELQQFQLFRASLANG
jgi:hypothetical protein